MPFVMFVPVQALRAWVLQWCRAGAVRVFAIQRAQRIARGVLAALAQHAQEQQEEHAELEVCP
jgi:hypothetical protein